jgi:chromosome segregation ATPase
MACLTAAGAGGAVCAQTARSGGNANAQLMQQMQQLASERTTLQAENDKLKGELANVTKDRDALKTAQQGLSRRATDAAAALARDSAQRQASDQELTQLKAKMQELIAKFRETIQKLREAESDDSATKQSLTARERELSVCAERNVALYNLDEEVLSRWEKEGVWTRIADKEPFTRIKRTQLENLIDDYRTRAGEQRVAPAHGNGSASTGAVQPAQPQPAPAAQAHPEPPAATPKAAAAPASNGAASTDH